MSDHPAYVAFMAHWDAPLDLSNGSRQGMDDHEMRIVYAAQEFLAAEPPDEVREALVAFLRTSVKSKGAWDYAGQALRVIED